jgi:hypothetical protein
VREIDSNPPRALEAIVKNKNKLLESNKYSRFLTKLVLDGEREEKKNHNISFANKDISYFLFGLGSFSFDRVGKCALSLKPADIMNTITEVYILAWQKIEIQGAQGGFHFILGIKFAT